MKYALTPEHIDEIPFQVPARLDHEMNLFLALILRFEFGAEVTVEFQDWFSSQLHRAVLSVNAVRQPRVVSQRTHQKDRPFTGIICGHEEGVGNVTTIFLDVKSTAGI